MKRMVFLSLVFFLAAGALFILNPSFNEHKAALAPEVKIDSPLWDKLEYRNYSVVSFTADAEQNNMVSMGVCNYIKISDDNWVESNNNNFK
jgi:hypothetical protein